MFVLSISIFHTPPVDESSKKKWLYHSLNFKEGDIISGGDIFGVVEENKLMPKHYIMCPPNVKGQVSFPSCPLSL